MGFLIIYFPATYHSNKWTNLPTQLYHRNAPIGTAHLKPILYLIPKHSQRILHFVERATTYIYMLGNWTKNPYTWLPNSKRKFCQRTRLHFDASSPKQSQKRISVDLVSEVTHSSWLSSTTVEAGSSRAENHFHLLWWIWSRNFWRYSTVNTSVENHHYQQNLKQAETDVNMITQC